MSKLDELFGEICPVCGEVMQLRACVINHLPTINTYYMFGNLTMACHGRIMRPLYITGLDANSGHMAPGQ